MFPADAKLYVRPTAFVDAPFDRDGQVLRLAGGMLWFSAVEIIARTASGAVSSRLVPIEKLEDTLAALPDAQQQSVQQQLRAIQAPRAPLTLGTRTIRLDQPQIMGILNVTPDSFSDGGAHGDAPQAAADAGFAMSQTGAAIIDIGGESTRPGATTVWEEDEKVRVLPVITSLVQSGAALSVDTRKASVMQAALKAGAQIVNDVSALLYDDRALEVVVAAQCPVILMHHQGDPQTMQLEPRYDNALLDVYDWLEERRNAVIAAGVAPERIILDPGIGFGKTVRHNLALLNGLSLFHALGCPLLLGASRKRLIGALDNEAQADARLAGSLALVMAGANQGIQLFRVHDVAETKQALRVWRGLRDEALSPV